MQDRRSITTLRGINEYVEETITWIKGGCEGTKPKPAWRGYKLFPSPSSITEGICYSTNNADVTRLFKTAGIAGKDAVVHLRRISEVCRAIEEGVSIRDIETAGGWSLKSEAQQTYVTGAMVPAVLLPMGGWDMYKDSYFCSWEGNKSDIYPELAAMVFPELDNIGSKLMAIKTFAMVHPKVMSDDDWNAELLSLQAYDYYRTIYIQDAIYMQPKYLSWPAYKNRPLFEHPMWAVYAAEEQLRIEARSKAYFSTTTAGQFEELKSLIIERTSTCSMPTTKRKVIQRWQF